MSDRSLSVAVTDAEMLDWLERQMLAKDGKWRPMGRNLLVSNGEKKRVHLYRGDYERNMKRIGTGATLRGAILNAMQTAAARSLADVPPTEPSEASEVTTSVQTEEQQS